MYLPLLCTQMLHHLGNHSNQYYLQEMAVSYLHLLEQFVDFLEQPSLLLVLLQVYLLHFSQQQPHLFRLELLCLLESCIQMLFHLDIVLDQCS